MTACASSTSSPVGFTAITGACFNCTTSGSFTVKIGLSTSSGKSTVVARTGALAVLANSAAFARGYLQTSDWLFAHLGREAFRVPSAHSCAKNGPSEAQAAEAARGKHDITGALMQRLHFEMRDLPTRRLQMPLPGWASQPSKAFKCGPTCRWCSYPRARGGPSSTSVPKGTFFLRKPLVLGDPPHLFQHRRRPHCCWSPSGHKVLAFLAPLRPSGE